MSGNDTPSALTTQFGGNHYTKMVMQPMQLSMRLEFNAIQHTISKYVSRYKNKNGLQDLQKAMQTCDLGGELDEFAERYNNSVPCEWSKHNARVIDEYCFKNAFDARINRILELVGMNSYSAARLYIELLAQEEYSDA